MRVIIDSKFFVITTPPPRGSVSRGMIVGVSIRVAVNDSVKTPSTPEASADGGTDMIVVLDERIRLRLGDRQEAGRGRDAVESEARKI